MTHKIHHGSDLGEATTFPLIIYFMLGHGTSTQMSFCLAISDALLSPLLDPLEGPSMLNCRKLGLESRSRLPALKGGKGAC
jgi:hypothetical protein